MNRPAATLQRQFNTDLPVFSLKVLIILWAVMVIGAALLINNKWVLAGILAWEILP